MFFLLWLLTNLFMHMSLALLWSEWKTAYNEATLDEMGGSFQDNLKVIKERFLSDAFWIVEAKEVDPAEAPKA